MAILKLCLTCGKPSDRSRCPEHRPKDMRPNADARGYDSKWQRTRHLYLYEHPVCEQEGCTEPATDVHHLDGCGPKGPYGHDPMNLEALCHSHHSQRTAQEHPAGFILDSGRGK